MVSDLDRTGGAAIAAERLAIGLSTAGAEVTRFVVFPEATDGSAIFRRGLRPTPGLPDRLWRRIAASSRDLKRIATRLSARSDLRHLRREIGAFRPDVISLHNVHYASWNATHVAALEAIAPVVWTLHDMWSFTGRCAYAGDCTRHLTGCDASCPTPEEYPALAPRRIRAAWKAKRDLLAKRSKLVAVAPSHWLAEEARRSLWKQSRVEVIPNGVNLDFFRATNRISARDRFRLPRDAWILLAYGEVSSEGRKGEELGLKVLTRLSARPTPSATLAVQFGRWPGHHTIQGLETRNFGFLKGEESVRDILSAADALLYPSLADNLPNILIESIACGTPVLAFNVGGIPEIVEPGRNGLLAPLGDSRALADHVVDLSEGRHPEINRAACRDSAERFDSRLQAARYLTLFSELAA